MMKIRVIIHTLVAVILIPVFSIAGDVMFIGNPSVPASELSSNDIKNIFLGSKITWSDGSEVIFVIQKKSTCHKLFLEKYIGKTPGQFSDYWRKLIFTGKGLAPLEKDSDQEIIKFVSQTEGAIGYVSPDSGRDNVKIISVK